MSRVLAQFPAVYSRNWAADSANSRVRLKAELDRANQEIALLRFPDFVRYVVQQLKTLCPTMFGIST